MSNKYQAYLLAAVVIAAIAFNLLYKKPNKGWSICCGGTDTSKIGTVDSAPLKFKSSDSNEIIGTPINQSINGLQGNEITGITISNTGVGYKAETTSEDSLVRKNVVWGRWEMYSNWDTPRLILYRAY